VAAVGCGLCQGRDRRACCCCSVMPVRARSSSSAACIASYMRVKPLIIAMISIFTAVSSPVGLPRRCCSPLAGSAAGWGGGSVDDGSGEVDQLSDQPAGRQTGEGGGDLGAGVLAVCCGGMGVQRHAGLGAQEVERAGDEHGE
jgi:hypothetical protein